MLDITAIPNMSDADLEAARAEAMAKADAVFDSIKERPRFSSHWLRRSMYDPTSAERLKAEQAAWDASNPGVADAAGAAQDYAEALRVEHEKRATHREREEWIYSTLDDAPRIRAVVQKGLDDSPAHDAVRDWARGKSWCLLLLGGVGCGKSTACGHFAIEVARKEERRPVWARAVEASRMSAFGDDAEQRFAKWREANLLVLDDLGTELMTPTWQQALDDILDYRYQHSLRTLLPTNLSAEEFKKRYGERIADRIRHEGTIRQLAGESMRRRS